MNVNALWPSIYLAASDLSGQDRDVRIVRITIEEVGQKKDKVPILYFHDVAKGMCLNKTNGKRIAKVYGNETDAWLGKVITLYPSETDWKNEIVPCIRVRDSVPAVTQVSAQTSVEQLEAQLAAAKAAQQAKA